MTRSAFAWFGAVLLALGVVARLHNAWASPVLAGYDAFAHFTYVWFVAETGRAPLPTHGWSFFHPPLYYASMAAIWEATASADPAVRLKTGKVLVAALGCIPALLAWRLVGRRFPGRTAVRIVAAGFTRLVPVQLYSAGFLGNEGLHAVFGALSLAALLAVLDRPSAPRALLLGACLGLAMLAKFSAIAMVAAALVAVLVCSRRRHGLRRAVVAASLASCAALAICGWYFARNVAAYGTPFQLSRGTFMVAYVEENQPQAARGWADYLTFDPMIFRRPVWPRGAGLGGDASPHGIERGMRESVWTGLYANTWFDGYAGFVVPPVVESEVSRRAGQILLTLGLVPTLTMALGIVVAFVRLRRRGPDDTVFAFALMTAAMLALFVYGTHEAPIAAAVKATYFTPIVLVFAYWLSEGLAALEDSRPSLARAVTALCALLGTISLAVFWQGLLFDPEAAGGSLPRAREARLTQYGIVEYAGGRVERARASFEEAAKADYHLGVENLAYLAIDDGHAGKGLRLLQRASRLQQRNPEGGPHRREEFLALAAAEYDHSMGVAAHAIGRRGKAVSFWHRALQRDPRHAEALWCVTLALLEDRLATAEDDAARRMALADASRALDNVRRIDPGLKEGWTLAAVVEAAGGDCDGAKRLLDEYAALPPWIERNYPAETGTGAAFSAAIGRRRLITPRARTLAESPASCGLKVQ